MNEAEELRLVVFKLDDGEYAVDVSQVREIIELRRITKLPRAPEFVEGIINLRGQLTTVLDLRRLFNLPEGDTTNARIVVLDQEGPAGIIVDAVTEVLSLTKEEIDKPDRVFGIDASFIVGVGKRDDRLIIILELSRILSPEEMGRIAKVREEVKE
ncbi:chemotaxis protein CheW [Candidatus Pyrohabitans sp.]